MTLQYLGYTIIKLMPSQSCFSIFIFTFKISHFCHCSLPFPSSTCSMYRASHSIQCFTGASFDTTQANVYHHLLTSLYLLSSPINATISHNIAIAFQSLLMSLQVSMLPSPTNIIPSMLLHHSQYCGFFFHIINFFFAQPSPRSKLF